jgi:ParB family chromosome partitioning protein
MPREQGNLALAGFEDIFRVSVAPANGESITELPLAELRPPEFHPFQVNDDEAMTRLAESIRQHGVREPGIARPREEGGYELLCGNRRKRACEIAGLPTLPVIIRKLDDDMAAIAMTDSNLQQREAILPSERAWAYRVMTEALDHGGIKGEQYSFEIVAGRTGVKRSQLFRFIRLTELITTLIDKVDAKQLAFNPAVELSYLSAREQSFVAEAMAKHEAKPSLSQARRLRQLKKDGKLTAETIDATFAETERAAREELTDMARFREYFPKGYTSGQMGEVIVGLLREWRARAAGKAQKRDTPP